MAVPRHHVNPPDDIGANELAEIQFKDDLILALSLAESAITDLVSTVLYRKGKALELGQDLISKMTASKKIDLLKNTMKEIGKEDSETDNVIRKLKFLSEVRNRMGHGDKVVDISDDEIEIQKVFGTKPTKRYRKENISEVFGHSLFDIIDDIKYSFSDELLKIRDENQAF